MSPSRMEPDEKSPQEEEGTQDRREPVTDAWRSGKVIVEEDDGDPD